jgi:hypothetical protein
VSKIEKLSDRAKRGEYELVEPLDYRLLEKLPPEGTTAFNLYPIGTTVKELSKDFKQIPQTQISARIRSMHVQGLAKKVRMLGAELGEQRKGRASAGSAWQLTESGAKLLANWKEKSSNGS